jgi:hypothetical protein
MTNAAVNAQQIIKKFKGELFDFIRKSPALPDRI